MEDAFWPTMAAVIPVLVIGVGVAALVTPIRVMSRYLIAVGILIRLWLLALPAAGLISFTVSVWAMASGQEPSSWWRLVVMYVAILLMATLSGHLTAAVIQKNAAADSATDNQQQ